MMETPTTLNSGMCRCCSSEGTFKDIKTKYHWMGEEEIYADMLNDCFDIKILTPEDTDNGICEVCITQLRNAANFKKQVLHTEEQFKQRFCNKDPKNPIKLESADDEAMGSDHLSDADFSGAEYEVPIKQEVDEKPKAKKRPAKATTSRTKKAKSGAEASDQRWHSRYLTNKLSDVVDGKAASETNNDELGVVMKLDESSKTPRDGNTNQLTKTRRVQNNMNLKIIDVTSLKKIPTLSLKRNSMTKIGEIGSFPISQISVDRYNAVTNKKSTADKEISHDEKNVVKAALLDVDNSSELEEISDSQVEYIDEELFSSKGENIYPSNVASPTSVTYIDDSGEFLLSNIEYLEENEEEILKEVSEESKCLRRSKRKVRQQKTKPKKRINDPKLKHIKKNMLVKPRKVPIGSEIDFHHENLRTVLECSNATTFGCRGVWYYCTFCSAKYIDPRELKAHTLQNHNASDKECKEVLYSARQLRRYVMKLDITDLKCTLCHMECYHLRELMEHLHTEHFEPMNMDLPNHMIPFKFEGDLLRCCECNREFICFKVLLSHMSDHYKNHVCDVCDSAYITFHSLRQHVRKHADGEYICIYCQKTYDNKYKLLDHTRMVHLGQRKRNKCAYCDMTFKVFEDKAKHMEKKHGLKAPVVQCKACDRTFASTRLLTRHMKKFHLIEKRHQCPLCESRFHAGYMLKDHMAVHSKDKDFKCAVCDKAFARKKTLREHIRIHTNDRRFKCEFCGMAFVQKCSLIGHLKNKHSDDYLRMCKVAI